MLVRDCELSLTGRCPVRSVFMEDVKSRGELLKDRMWQREQDAAVKGPGSLRALTLDSEVRLGSERSKFVQGRPWVPALVCRKGPVGSGFFYVKHRLPKCFRAVFRYFPVTLRLESRHIIYWSNDLSAILRCSGVDREEGERSEAGSKSESAYLCGCWPGEWLGGRQEWVGLPRLRHWYVEKGLAQ